MIKQQPKALQLADRLDLYATGDKHQKDIEQATAEMRRLHKVNAELLVELQNMGMAEEGYDQIAAELRRLHSVNAELLVALKLAAEINPYGSVENAAARDAARAAIAKATGAA